MKPHPKIRKTVKWAGVVLSVVLLAAWVGSGWFNAFLWRSSGASWGVGAGHFFVERARGRLVTNDVRAWFSKFHDWEFSWSFRFWRFQDAYLLWIPLWAFIAPTLLLTVFAWRLDTLARRRARVGRCATCGYDLSATPATKKCPECGAGHT